jgi:signal transduction histidine kinase/ActR/RegA family two-component response regulator
LVMRITKFKITLMSGYQGPHPDDGKKILADIDAHIRAGETEHRAEFRFRHRDGHYLWILTHASIIYDEAGNAERIVGSHIDITDRKMMEQSFLQNQKMEALGTLAGGIAHDFNNLLTPILGYTTLLKRQHGLDEKTRKHIDRIATAAERAKELVQTILVVSRRSALEMEEVSLRSLLQEVLAVLEASAPKNVRISVKETGSIPSILADPAKIYQVLLNLCTNAVQAMEQGGELIIEMSTAAHAPDVPDQDPSHAGYAQLTVKDTGAGMSDAVKAQIFDPFFTTKVRSESRGTGLGLSIVAGIVKEHHGDITVASQEGVGTTFTVLLPIATQHTPQEEQDARLQGRLKAGTVALIDDDEMVRELGVTMLREMGMEVEAFDNGPAALAAIERGLERFSVLITDYTMPDMSGPDLIKRVKTLAPDLPIILFSGYSNLSGGDRAAEIGYDKLLVKPYQYEALEQTLKEILGSK